MQWLDRYDGRARVVGGGTDLLLEIQQGAKPAAEALVDTSRIAGLNTIKRDGKYIVIGCAVTHAQIARDALLACHGACLLESCGVIGGPQVRNVATLAGNVAHALPAGDGSIGLLALGGDIEVTGTHGSRWMPLQDAFLGPGKSAIDHHRHRIGNVEGVVRHQQRHDRGNKHVDHGAHHKAADDAESVIFVLRCGLCTSTGCAAGNSGIA